MGGAFGIGKLFLSNRRRCRVYIGTNDETLDDERFEPIVVVYAMSGRSDRQGIVEVSVTRLEIDRSKVSEDFDDMNLGILLFRHGRSESCYIVTKSM